MGDPKKQRKKYSPPKHPWQRARIESEKELIKLYGLGNKREIWKMNSILRKLSRQAKRLAATRSAQAEAERANLLKRAQRIGLLKEESKVDDILTLGIHDIMNRRLQTLVCRKNFARTMLQARQMIVHEHIVIGDKKINSPSYIVGVEEEPLIGYYHSSSFLKPEHPERIIPPKEGKKEGGKEEKKGDRRERRWEGKRRRKVENG